MESVKYAEQELAAGFKKNKPLTVFLALLCPGAGHLYLGEPSRAIWFMTLFFTNSIFLIFTLESLGQFRALIAACLFSVGVVVYAINILNALQQVNLVNVMDQLKYFEETEADGRY
ncbi:DUF6677 family protein [Paenibacillus sp. GCM10012307]|uniref:Uncharacterized protein n=1 Tax=Paenibacillus roseus TaxID=2798579 RepID=A0A934J5E9_9BACL|nr:DUF6677 family protein [Paenibacillus roseus]MBJ6363614.1 hypothetical protein [Paenibacillus roseus]